MTEVRPIVTEGVIVNTLDLRDAYTWRFKSNEEVVRELFDGRKVILIAKGARIPPEVALIQGQVKADELWPEELIRCRRAVAAGHLDAHYLEGR